MYPFQLSGGQNQRILIAMGVILNPELLIADEPTSAVDSSLRKKILDLFVQINVSSDMSILIITHDFDIIKYICRKLIIMYGGLVMEEGSVEEILKNPLHPYTEELINCTRSLNSKDETLYSLQGTPPSPLEFTESCPFYGRCSQRKNICKNNIPDMVKIKGRQVRCVLHSPVESQKEGE
jgi:peptide/nickel transport system ATP-binding protein